MDKILVHICCSVDSHFFLQKLQQLYKNTQLIGYFYNPNIHPYSEYFLRLLDVKRSCEKLNIPLIEEEYDYNSWLNDIKGLEDEPEKGKRCLACFDNRLEKTFQKAKELNINYVTTTLLTSPKKSLEDLLNQAKKFEEKYNIKFLLVDFRKGGGTQEQFKLAKQDNLYKQDYCGCMFALKKQREFQNSFYQELICPINNQVLDGSIEEKIKLFEEKTQLDEQKIPYYITKFNFLNYRLLRAFVKLNKQVVPSHFLTYSVTKKQNIKAKVEFEANSIKFLSKENIKVISLSDYSAFMIENYKNIKDVIFSKIDFEKELELKKQLSGNNFDLTTIIVLEDDDFFAIDENSKLEIYLNQVLFQASKDKIILK